MPTQLRAVGDEAPWEDAPVRPSEFVVIIGDVLERMTNGVLRATPHRVLPSLAQVWTRAYTYFELRTAPSALSLDGPPYLSSFLACHTFSLTRTLPVVPVARVGAFCHHPLQRAPRRHGRGAALAFCHA